MHLKQFVDIKLSTGCKRNEDPPVKVAMSKAIQCLVIHTTKAS